MTTGMFSIFEGDELTTARSGSATLLDDASATRRWNHEMPPTTRTLASPEPVETQVPKDSNVPGDELGVPRKEYWDPVRK